MNIWKFIKPNLKQELICEVEQLAKKYPFRHKLVPTISREKEHQAKEILSILCSNNVAVPIEDNYGKSNRENIMSQLDDGDYPDLAFIMFTSGTTGNPKGVMLTHENIRENLKSIESYFKISSEDKMLIARPLSHIAVLTGELLYGLYKGAIIKFFEEAFMPQRLAKKIIQEDISVFCCTPTLFLHLSNYLTSSKLKTIVLSGERLNSKVIELIKEKFSNISFYNVYGLTEHSPRAFALLPTKFIVKAPSIGLSIQGVEAKLIDDELYLKSKSVMKGYYKNYILTKQKIVDGWLNTGDKASVDENGYYTILGRTDNMIIRSGLNIYPAEIESVVMQFAKIENCIAYGEEDLLYGQKICLQVVGNVDISELRKYLLNNLPPHLMPNKMEIVERLKMTASGKIKR